MQLKFSLLAFVLLGLGFNVNAQFSHYWRVDKVHYPPKYPGDLGDPLGYDLNGYITYSLMVTCEKENDRVFTVVANPADIYGDILIESTSGFFQHPSGSFSAKDITQSDWEDFEALKYDSFVTIKKDYDAVLNESFATPNATIVRFTFEGTLTPADYFDGGRLYVNNGFWLTSDDSQKLCGPEKEVKIGQFTTEGDMSACFVVGVTPEGKLNQNIEMCSTFANPCIANPIDTFITEPNVTVLCYGDIVSFEAGDGTGGNGPASTRYDVYAGDGSLFHTQIGNHVLPVTSGDGYYVVITDSVGCIDTTSSFNVSGPLPLEISTLIDKDILCFAENDAIISPSASGGTQPYNFTLNNGSLIGEGASWTDLSCGNYVVRVEDDHNCKDSLSVPLICPAELSLSLDPAVNIACPGLCDGSISGSVLGGTDSLTMRIFNACLDTTFTKFIGSLDFAFNDLCACPDPYVVTVTDANNCVVSDNFEISEPEVFVFTKSIIQEVQCHDEKNGHISFSVSGGTGAVVLEVKDSLGVLLTDLTALAAGTYYAHAIDSKGCLGLDSLVLVNPEQLIMGTPVLTDISCFGADDGSLLFDGIKGGTGALSYTLTPNNGSQTIQGDSLVLYSNVTVANYSFEVKDSRGCAVSASNLLVAEPNEILLTLSKTDISCNNLTDGKIQVNAAGGSDTLTVRVFNSCIDQSYSGAGVVAFEITDLAPCAEDYDVVVSDINGCSVQDSVYVINPEVLTLDHTVFKEITCFGANDGKAIFTAAGGTGEVLLSCGSDTLFNLPAGWHSCVATDVNGCTAQDSLELIQPAEILYNAPQITHLSCHATDDGVIMIDGISGGVGNVAVNILPLSGTQINGPGSATFTDLPGNTYTIRLSDDTGCVIDLAGLKVIDPDEISIGLTAKDISCFGLSDGQVTGVISGGSGLLTARLYNSCFDNTYTGTSNVLVSATGLLSCPDDYVLEVVDENNCSNADSYSIAEPLEMVINMTMSREPSCFGVCDGQVSDAPLGGTGSITVDLGPYNWDAMCAGAYEAVATDANGCVVKDSIYVTQPAEIIFKGPLVSNVSCFKSADAVIKVYDIAGGVGNISLALSQLPNVPVFSGDTAIFAGLSGGSYSLVFTDDTGCSVVETGIQVLEPSKIGVQLTPTDISCFGLTDGQIAVSCIGGSGMVQIIAPVNAPCPSNITDLPAGSHVVEVQDENGCSQKDSVSVTEPPLLEMSVSVLANVSCGGLSDGQIEASASGGVAPLTPYINGAVSSPIDFVRMPAGDHDFCYIDRNGCDTCTVISITEPEELKLLIDLEPVTCTGMNDGSATVVPVGGTPPIELVFADKDLDLSNLFEGTYLVEASDDNNCFVKDTIVIGATLVTDMLATTSSTPVTCWDKQDGSATVNVTGGFLPLTYGWNDPQEQNTAQAIGLAEDDYSVVIIDQIGCTISATVTVEPTLGCLFVATALTPNGDGANDYWVVGGLEYFPDATVQVFNRWGQLMFESTGYATSWDGTYNGNKLPVADYYFVIDYTDDAEPVKGTVTIKY